ncbi:hypothetical protein LCGC14_1747990 [marine sediment metagenome]|uniref:Uncharacterized protein n=1 Tax=marine sediment metagenome TaxID=412755 RepID=A0A0F9HS36_9ZZZZ
MTKKAQHPNSARSTISGPTANKQRSFVSRTDELAQMFTKPVWHNRNKAGKYLEGGLKPIETFCSDIQSNLIYWAIEGVTTFYRTPDFWYMFQLADANGILGNPSMTEEVIWMTRHRNDSWERLDDWANPYSVKHIGRKFLLGYPDKQVPLFNTGESS